MKKIVCLMMALVLCSGLVGCATHDTKASEHIKINKQLKKESKELFMIIDQAKEDGNALTKDDQQKLQHYKRKYGDKDSGLNSKGKMLYLDIRGMGQYMGADDDTEKDLYKDRKQDALKKLPDLKNGGWDN